VHTVSRTPGADLLADLTDVKSLRALFEHAGAFDAVACAAGDVFPAPLDQTTDEQWAKSFAAKAMGQINLVRAALPFIADHGSFTLISGIVPDEPIVGGVIMGRSIRPSKDSVLDHALGRRPWSSFPLWKTYCAPSQPRLGGSPCKPNTS